MYGSHAAYHHSPLKSTDSRRRLYFGGHAGIWPLPAVQTVLQQKRRYKDGSLSDNLSISLALFVCSLSELNRFWKGSFLMVDILKETGCRRNDSLNYKQNRWHYEIIKTTLHTNNRQRCISVKIIILKYTFVCFILSTTIFFLLFRLKLPTYTEFKKQLCLILGIATFFNLI